MSSRGNRRADDDHLATSGAAPARDAAGAQVQPAARACDRGQDDHVRLEAQRRKRDRVHRSLSRDVAESARGRCPVARAHGRGEPEVVDPKRALLRRHRGELLAQHAVPHDQAPGRDTDERGDRERDSRGDDRRPSGLAGDPDRCDAHRRQCSPRARLPRRATATVALDLVGPDRPLGPRVHDVIPCLPRASATIRRNAGCYLAARRPAAVAHDRVLGEERQS